MDFICVCNKSWATDVEQDREEHSRCCENKVEGKILTLHVEDNNNVIYKVWNFFTAATGRHVLKCFSCNTVLLKEEITKTYGRGDEWKDVCGDRVPKETVLKGEVETHTASSVRNMRVDVWFL